MFLGGISLEKGGSDIGQPLDMETKRRSNTKRGESQIFTSFRPEKCLTTYEAAAI